MRDFDIISKNARAAHYFDVKAVDIAPINFTDVWYGDAAVNWQSVVTVPDAYWLKDKKAAQSYKTIDPTHTKEDGAVLTQRPGCAFDIETTAVNIYDEVTRKGRKVKKCTSAHAYMYKWQFAIDDYIIHGRTWAEFLHFLDMVVNYNIGAVSPSTIKMLTVWIANMGYEFQFMRKQMEIAGWRCVKLFARECRQPLNAYFEKNGFIIWFRDALAVSNSSLEGLSKLYNLPTKKSHDLDYSIPRNSMTKLTADELNYCSVDVRILVEFHDWLYTNYVSHGLPIQMTATGHVRHDEKVCFNEFEKEQKTVNGKVKRVYKRFAKTILPAMFPATYDDYIDRMTKCFAGGFTHANAALAGRTIGTTPDCTLNAPVNGGDFTSSYPYVMMFQKFPMKPFYPTTRITDINQIDGSKPTIARIRFTNLWALTTHSIISISKTYEYDECGKKASLTAKKYGMIVDNGRIVKADTITIETTDVDLEYLRKFYEWDDAEILYCEQSAEYGYLPDYVRWNLASYYGKKNALKRAGLDGTSEYNIAKAGANSNYGLMCQKQNVEEILYENSEWKTNIDELTMNDVEDIYRSGIKDDYGNMKTINSPYWAIWTTAHARANLLELLYEIGNDAIYCDTDSIYYMFPDSHIDTVKRYNDRIHVTNTQKVDAWNAAHSDDMQLDIDLFYDLGEFDKLNKKGDYIRFKTLGAKRYLKEGPNKKGEMEIVQTVAGLPKTALIDHCAKLGIDPFEFFEPGMLIPACKRAHAYNDEPTADFITDLEGNTEEMTELSSVGIFDIDFSMDLDDDYMELIAAYAENQKRKNYREIIESRKDDKS